MPPETYRTRYADLIMAKGGSTNPDVKAAFAAVDRARFVGPGPWKVFTRAGYTETSSDDPALLYQDVLIALDAERQINNGEPSLHVRCMAAVAPRHGDHVLHVGAGTGYYTAILAHIVGEGGSVTGYEVQVDLAARAKANLAELSQVAIESRSAVATDLPPSDVIYVSAGATHPPPEWLSALRLGGRLIFPLSGARGTGIMLMITHLPHVTYAARSICGAAFIPCVGAFDGAEAESIAAALRTGGHSDIRSLVRDSEPDGSAWLSGKGWWLSTRQPQDRQAPRGPGPAIA